MINSINNNINFTGLNFYHIGSRAKERKYLNQAAKTPLLKGQLKALEDHGIDFDVVRRHGVSCQPTEFVDLFMSRKPSYHTKNGLNPLQGVVGKVNSLEDAQLLIAKGIEKSIRFMKKHFEYAKEAKKLGIE